MSQTKRFGITLIEYLEKEKMNPNNERMLTEYLVAAMTSGLKQTGAKYQMPESLALEYGRLCYNQAIKDLQAVFTASNFGQLGLEVSDHLQELHIHQKGKNT